MKQMVKRCLIGALVGILTCASGVVVAERAEASPDLEACFANLIGQARGGGVRIDPGLANPARAHAEAMARADRIYHSDLRSQYPGHYRVLGENVAVGMSCERIHQALMDSPGHRANILRPGWDALGIGVVHGRDGAIFVAQAFGDDGGAQVSSPRPGPRTIRRCRLYRHRNGRRHYHCWRVRR